MDLCFFAFWTYQQTSGGERWRNPQWLYQAWARGRSAQWRYSGQCGQNCNRKKKTIGQSVRIVLKRHCHEICNHYFFRNLIYRHLIKYFFLGWASVLFKRTERSLSSFPFLIKEWNDLCVLFRFYKKNRTIFVFFSDLY